MFFINEMVLKISFSKNVVKHEKFPLKNTAP